MLYPETQIPAGYTSPPTEMQYSPEAFNFSQSAGFEAAAMYAGEAPHFSYHGRASPESGDLRVPSSSLSTASAPSAPSSTVGSPLSNPGQLAFIPEYHQNALGVNPSIVQPDYYTSTEYSFTAPVIDDFSGMTYEGKPGFVGELSRIPRDSVSRTMTHDGLVSVIPPPLQSSLALDTNVPQVTPNASAVMSGRTASAVQSSLLLSAGSHLGSPGFRGGSSPVPRRDTSASFLLQNSGHLVAPLCTSCWFPLSNSESEK